MKDIERLLHGAIDMHVHAYPDVSLNHPQHRTNDDVIAQCRAAGMGGLVLKTHGWPSVGLAHQLNSEHDDFTVYPSASLNTVAGGPHPWVVEMAIEMGCKMIWLPTWSAASDHEHTGFGVIAEKYIPRCKTGIPKQEKMALTDEQVKILLDTIRGLPPYVFVMIGLYAGLRREEILALRWDCVFLDGAAPYISVRRAWRSVNNRPVISTELKTPAAKRDIPIPGKLVECLKEAKEKSKSEYVISDRNGNALAESQFVRVWKYIAVRSTEERCYYTYVNGQKIKHVVKPKLGEHQPNNPKLVYTMDFQVTPHQLRHTYITNLIYASVDPKTVQYLAGHENSKVTMDIYAKVKYNKPAQLHGVINRAIDTSKKD